MVTPEQINEYLMRRMDQEAQAVKQAEGANAPATAAIHGCALSTLAQVRRHLVEEASAPDSIVVTTVSHEGTARDVVIQPRYHWEDV